jgi:NAD(P)-dependent dehydrogenase (short-subunit alcohol dehydrogenase family)
VPREGAVDLDLADKIAVVTGAGRGIGLALTTALADEGAPVLAASRSIETLEGLSNVTLVASDLSMPEAPAALIERAMQEFGRANYVIAGGLIKTTMTEAMRRQQLTSPIQTGGLRWSRVPALG